jgi:ParB family transcriptional regulator, chromosome partitioning protein
MTKRKALGKGLSALIPDADHFEDGETVFFQCPIETISPNPNQPRQQFSPIELDDMAASVREKGIITPLLVSRTEEGYQLIAGERRWRAAQKAGLQRVPVVVRDVTPVEALELALIENIHRTDLNPIEEAAAYNNLLEQTGMTQEELAKRLGKDRSSVTNLLRLLRLPTHIQQDVMDGRLSMGHARLLAGIKDFDAQKALRDAIVRKALSVRQAEALAKKGKVSAVLGGKGTCKDPYVQSLEDRLKRSLGTKVEIKTRGGGGQITVHFYSNDELDRLMELFFV